MATSDSRPLFPVCVGVGLLAVMTAAPAALGGAPKKNADPQYVSYLKQLHDRFQEWDRNHDHVLDKAELARAFRGAKAKPYDEFAIPKIIVIPAKLPATPTESPRLSSTSVMIASLPTGGLSVNLAIAELLAQNRRSSSPSATEAPAAPTIMSTAPPDVNAYADVQFLQLLNKVKNGKITKQQYDTWAKSYAGLVNRFVDNERDVKAAKQRLKNATNPKSRQEAQKSLARQEREWQQVQNQLNAIPIGVQRAFHLKR